MGVWYCCLRHLSSVELQLVGKINLEWRGCDMRNYSPHKMFMEMADKHVPEFSFSATTKEQFVAWKEKALPEVLKTLGKIPKKVSANPELIAEWNHDGLRKQRWSIDVGENIAAICQVNYPVNIKDGEKLPAILCWHGHGDFGMEPVMGNDSSDGVKNDIAEMNYNYGHCMAKEGYVTYAVDWLGCGCSKDNAKPYYLSQGAGRDWCNLYYLNATMLGTTSLAINLSRGRAATDFICSLPGIDATKLGVMGLSGGGTMSLWTALTDERIKAAEVICYSGLWADFGIRDINYCGMQVAPGLYNLVDLPDLQGLLAPRPLLIDIGIQDKCFDVDSAMQCYKKVKSIYKVAGASEGLEDDIFNGPHSWGGNKSAGFFRKHF